MHKLETKQHINTSLEKAWDFFTSPENLPKLTPKKMSFKIIGEVPSKTYSGQIIQYKVSLMLGIAVGWTTEIKNVIDQKMFIDEQRFGPYKFWYHTHLFEKTENGVLMTDTVYYKLPFGFFGKLLNFFYVKNELKIIFDYRFKMVEQLFNTTKND